VAPATFGYAPPVSALGVDARADDHDHVVAFYEGERDLVGAVAAHLAPALGHGGAAVANGAFPDLRRSGAIQDRDAFRAILSGVLADQGMPDVSKWVSPEEMELLRAYVAAQAAKAYAAEQKPK